MADTKEEIYCPACESKMTKLFIPKYNHYIDICLEGCGGIFFDNRELGHFDENRENIDIILNALKNRGFKKVDTSKTRICPSCGAPMTKNYTSANNSIEIDECYSCGGKFLDCNELEQIRNEFDTEEERAQDFNNNFLDKYIDDIIALDKQREKSISERSFLRKLFLAIYEK